MEQHSQHFLHARFQFQNNLPPLFFCTITVTRQSLWQVKNHLKKNMDIHSHPSQGEIRSKMKSVSFRLQKEIGLEILFQKVPHYLILHSINMAF